MKSKVSPKVSPVEGRTEGWDETRSSQEEIIANLLSPLGDSKPDFLDERVLRVLVATIGAGFAGQYGLWDRLELNLSWIDQTLREGNPELADELKRDFNRFAHTLWSKVLQYRWADPYELNLDL